MKAAVRDADLLRSVQPAQVTSYLEMKGWNRETVIPDKASIWTREDSTGDQAEILLPLDPTFQDFPIRISQILSTLETVEQRSQLEIFENLVLTLSDIISIRLSHDDFSDGTIPLNQGVNFVNHAKNMVLSAACSTVDAKAHFERKKPPQANKYLKNVRFGQTKKGSFILTIVSPIFQPQLPMDTVEPFERSVVKKLYHSLTYVKLLAEEINVSRLDFKIPDDSKDYGLSSNLCDALVGINNSGKMSGIEINLSWSSAIAISEDISNSIIFPQKIMPTIARLGRRLKADIQKNFEFRGEVYSLKRQRKDSTGTVTLLGKFDHQDRKIKVELNDLAYQRASQANKDRRLIFCKGDLIKEGRIFTLLNPKRFSLLEESVQSDKLADQISIELDT